MSLPESIRFLIVGAGPSGLACAISLIYHGCRELVVVDAVLEGQNTSRAMVIHAATLEALDTVGCADALVEIGIKASGFSLNNRTTNLLSADFSYLEAYTRFPYVLLLPQNITERELGRKLQDLGVQVCRPKTVVGMKQSDSDDNAIDVAFESGEVVRANYVIGADGAKSIVRQLSGISFDDPDGGQYDGHPGLSQIILADVIFSPEPDPPLSTSQVMGFASPNTFFGVIPLPAPWVCGPDAQLENTHNPRQNIVHRIGCGVPHSFGTPPHAPDTAYLQTLVNAYGPRHLSSDPAVNSHPVRISETIWSTRYRNRAAIAEQFFIRFGDKQSGLAGPPKGGVVFLIGDAAHIHSPAGGQGMNLGLRDAVGLGPVLAEHHKASCTLPCPPDIDKPLSAYAAARHARGVGVIQLTKTLVKMTKAFKPIDIGSYLSSWILSLLGKFQFVRNAAAWRLSGLGAR